MHNDRHGQAVGVGVEVGTQGNDYALLKHYLNPFILACFSYILPVIWYVRITVECRECIILYNEPHDYIIAVEFLNNENLVNKS